MLRSYRLLIAAVVGLAVFQPVYVPCHAQTDTSEANEAPKQNPPPIDMSPIANEIKGLSRAIESIKPEVKSADETQREKDDLQAQQDMANWARLMYYATAVTAVLTAVGIVLLGFTLHFTKRAAIAGDAMVIEAQKTTIAAHQTLEVTKAGLAGRLVRRDAVIRHDADKMEFVIVYRCINSGKFPATGIDIRALVIVDPDGETRIDEFTSKVDIADAAVGTEGAIKLHCDGFALTEAEFDKAIGGGLPIDVEIELSYTDGFGRVARRDPLTGILKPNKQDVFTAVLITDRHADVD